ncbi:hypothetical protein K0M31_003460 [Melipona bicolor]|uniref:Odorant receptor n=1 Tax=Melipona bicolor TaxID=60889 RepID=A0AA40FZ08_9HYME|nr:hypothetical protein K0M31_003460 [Melipona bicolor]
MKLNDLQYKMLLNTIWEDWSKDRAKDELEIMVEYAEKTAFFSRMYFVVGTACTASFVQQALSPIVLDIILPINETRDVVYIFPGYYLIDDRKYRSFIILHLTYVTIVAYYVFVGCDTNYVCVVQHACGQIAVARYDASWYNTNKETQLLFVLALRSCLSPPILSAGGLLTLNLETFAQIIKGSVSYFTVLKSS